MNQKEAPGLLHALNPAALIVRSFIHSNRKPFSSATPTVLSRHRQTQLCDLHSFTRPSTHWCPCFPKAPLRSLHFYERPTLGACFPKEIPRGFLLLWKKIKSKNSIQRWSCSEPLQRPCEQPRQARFRGTTLSISAPLRQTARPLLCVCKCQGEFH